MCTIIRRICFIQLTGYLINHKRLTRCTFIIINSIIHLYVCHSAVIISLWKYRVNLMPASRYIIKIFFKRTFPELVILSVECSLKILPICSWSTFYRTCIRLIISADRIIRCVSRELHNNHHISGFYNRLGSVNFSDCS